jgi:hypothetical protein
VNEIENFKKTTILNNKKRIPTSKRVLKSVFILPKLQPYFFFNPTKYSTKFTASSFVIPSIKPVGIMELGNSFMDFTLAVLQIPLQNSGIFIM